MFSFQADILCTQYCSYINYFFSNKNKDMRYKYAMIQHGNRCPAMCSFSNAYSPNNAPGADAVVESLAWSLSTTITNPEGDAWYDKDYLSPYSKCPWGPFLINKKGYCLRPSFQTPLMILFLL